MKKFFITLLLLMMIVPLASATFLETENLTIPGGGNVTRFLILPEDTGIITQAFMNLTGKLAYNGSSFVEQDTTSNVCDAGIFGSFTNCAFADDNDWSTVTLGPTILTGVTWAGVNITQEWDAVGDIFNLSIHYLFTIRRSATGQHYVDMYCKNLTGGNFVFLQQTVRNGTNPSGTNFEELPRDAILDESCYDGVSTVTTRTESWGNSNGGQSRFEFFESNLTIGFGSKLLNPYLEVGDVDGTKEWSVTGNFTSTEQTDNLAQSINDYFSGCTFINATCAVPFVFFSDALGILEFFNFNATQDGFLEVSQTFNNNTVETTTETFIMNLTYDSDRYDFIAASLIYDNGTAVLGTNTGSGDTAIFTANLTIPLINQSLSSELKDFFWTITLTEGINQTTFDSTTQQQNVSKLDLVDCSAGGVTIINFTAAREDNLTEINPFEFEGVFTYHAGDGDVTKTLNVSRQTVPSKAICLAQSDIPSVTITDAQIKYDGPVNGVFVERDYHIQEQVFTNASVTDIELYLLDSGDSTSFILVVQDQNIIPITGALILIERFYPGLNEFRTVQIAKTDDDGKSVGFYEVETVDYRHTIMKDGVVLLVTTQQKIIGEEAPFTLTFTVGSILTAPLATFEDIENLDATLFFNATTKIVSFTYSDTSGNFTLAALSVELVNYNTLNTVLCAVNSTSSSGVLICDLTGEEGTFIAQGFISRSPGVLAKAIQFLISGNVDLFGTTGLFLAWFLILAAAMTGIWNPTVGVIATNMAVILVNLIGIATFSPIFIFGMIGVSLIVVILIKT